MVTRRQAQFRDFFRDKSLQPQTVSRCDYTSKIYKWIDEGNQVGSAKCGFLNIYSYNSVISQREYLSHL